MGDVTIVSAFPECRMQLVPLSSDGRVIALAPECVFASSRDGLVLLAAQRTVTVTREEQHQAVLAGRGGRVVVALAPCTISAGKYAGQRGIEVTLDGSRVGELTRLMAQRYLPMVDEAAARGHRVGCEALLRPDHRGMQVELRLPAVDGTAPAWSVPAPTVTVPRPRVAPTPTALGPTPPPYPVRPTRPRRGGRRALWAGAAVVGVLVFAGAVGNGAKTGTPTATAAVRSATASPAGPAATSTTPAGSATPTSTATATTAATSTIARSRTSGGAAAVAPPERPAAPRPTTRAETTTLAEPTTSLRARTTTCAPASSGWASCSPRRSSARSMKRKWLWVR
jgi:hypothetical protein